MNIQKLSWAGIQVESAGGFLMIDPLEKLSSPFDQMMGQPRVPLLPLPAEKPLGVLVTHLHGDHFDAETLLQRYGADVPMHVPVEAVRGVQKAGFANVHGYRAGEDFAVAGFNVTALPAVDGFHTPQVSWLVEADGHKLFHGGDTIWHGAWWEIARKYGPIDVAFLACNGVVLRIPQFQPWSSEPADMTPEQAVEAARLLRAETLVPMHHGQFDNPPYYEETPNVVGRLKAAAEEKAVNVRWMEQGESFHF